LPDIHGLITQIDNMISGLDKWCTHPGCKNHVTHPCEKCGYQAGRE